MSLKLSSVLGEIRAYRYLGSQPKGNIRWLVLMILEPRSVFRSLRRIMQIRKNPELFSLFLPFFRLNNLAPTLQQWNILSTFRVFGYDSSKVKIISLWSTANSLKKPFCHRWCTHRIRLPRVNWHVCDLGRFCAAASQVRIHENASWVAPRCLRLLPCAPEAVTFITSYHKDESFGRAQAPSTGHTTHQERPWISGAVFACKEL